MNLGIHVCGLPPAAGPETERRRGVTISQAELYGLLFIDPCIATGDQSFAAPLCYCEIKNLGTVEAVERCSNW